jgi:hypothetical protein
VIESGHLGTFSYLATDSNWSLSPEVYAMHGLDQGTPVDTDLISSFNHPDDRFPGPELMHAVLSRRTPVCTPYRIINTAGQIRSVVIIVQAVRDAAGRPVGIEGYALDFTDTQRRFAQDVSTAAIEGAMEHRAAIEQAKGVLMLAYGVTPEVAFELLRWNSRQYNVKLNLIAERLIEALRTVMLTSSEMRRILDRTLYDVAHTP